MCGIYRIEDLKWFDELEDEMDYTIRRLKDNEIKILERFLYNAIFQRDGEEPISEDIIYDPSLYIYVEDFGRDDDNCLVAEYDGEIVGAVWTRVLAGEPRGFGNIDKITPEFAISVLPENRGKGIGNRLMTEMIKLLAECGYEKTSLAVQKDNYALKLYKDVGFEVINETEEEYIMVCNLITEN